MKPWRTAADCIDWSVPAPSIFERTKPLAEATCRRIAKGIVRYVYEAAQPFVAPFAAENHHEQQEHAAVRNPNGRIPRGPQKLVNAFGTTTAQAATALAQAQQALRCFSRHKPSCHIRQPHPHTDPDRLRRTPRPAAPRARPGKAAGHRSGRPKTRAGHRLVKHYTGVAGSSSNAPLGTATTVDHHSLVTAHITRGFEPTALAAPQMNPSTPSRRAARQHGQAPAT